MAYRHLVTAACACALPGAALAQSSYIAPDGKNRYPGVTIFCASGTHVQPCAFGSSSGNGTFSINVNGNPVSSGNRLPVADTALDALIASGALSVGGTVALSGATTVSISGTPTTLLSVGGSPVSASNKLPVVDSALDALIAGGALSVGGTVAVSGTSSVSVSGTPSVSISGTPTTVLSVGGNPVSAGNRLPVADSALEALIAGGALSVGGTVAVSGTSSVSVSGTPSVLLSGGSAAIGSVSVSNLPATQAVSALSLPLPAGAATATQQSAPLVPVAPGTSAATASMLMGCLSNTTLPTFNAGQAGAVPCDSSGRPYVVTVPSASNVPSYLQAVSSGGASLYRAINAASSTMAANVKATSGLVYGYEACNSGSSAAYLRLFGLATAPVAGTSTPSIVKILGAGTCQGYSSTVGISLSNGIGVDVTTGSMADSDSTVIASANQVTVEIYYK